VPDSFDAAVSRIAKRQHRNITRNQLLSIGISATAVRNRLKIGLLHRTPFPGVYTVGTPAVTPHERAYAAILAGGPTAVLSHEPAMVLHNIWHRWPRHPEITITKGDRRPKNVTVHRCRTLTHRDRTRQYGIPVTSPARTLYDMEPRLTDSQLTRAVNSALHEQILRKNDLAEFLGRHPNDRLAYFITADPSLSTAEDEFLPFCDEYGIPRPSMGYGLRGRTVDAIWLPEGLIAELDGWGSHNTEHDFEVDRDRDADNLTAEYPTIRITRRRFKREPARIAQQIKTILANQRRRQAA
jgi:Transcriptional regulator, AbiEi antitoxin